MRGRVRKLFVVPALAGMLLAGCGGGDESDQQDAGGGTPLDDIEVRGEMGKKPKLVDFEGPVTFEETETRVLDEGDGEKVEKGQTVEVNYIGFNARDGESFDDSWQHGDSIPFDLKEGAVIDGFVDGLAGQRLGSRVLVGIPSEDGYPEGNGDDIKEGDSLLFVAELKEAWTPLTKATGEEIDPPEDLPAVEVNDKDQVAGVEIPDQEPPEELVAEPVIEGDGDEVTESSDVRMHMFAVNWDSGEPFENTWQQGNTMPLPLAQLGAEVPGLSAGLIGRQVGDRMVLVIPPDQGFDRRLPETDVKKDSTTVWVIDILGVQ